MPSKSGIHSEHPPLCFFLWALLGSVAFSLAPTHLTCNVVCPGYHNRISHPGWVHNMHLFSLFWKLKVQDQGACRVGFWWGLSYLTDGCFPACPGACPLWALIAEASSSFCKDTSPAGWGPCLWSHLALLLQIFHAHTQAWIEIKLQHIDLWYQTQSIIKYLVNRTDMLK